MKGFAHLLEHFQQAINTRDNADVMERPRSNPRVSPNQQMSERINNYRLRLVSALKSDYPALAAYLGNVEFEHVARAFIECTPSSYFNLHQNPHQFAAFLAMRGGDGFAIDLAELEGAMADVFLGNDSNAMQPQAFDGLSSQEVGALNLPPRADSRLIALDYPAHEWLASFFAGKTLPRPEMCPSYLHIYRHEGRVERAQISAEQHALLSEIFEGRSVLAACTAQKLAIGEVMPWLKRWVAQGFFQSPRQ